MKNKHKQKKHKRESINTRRRNMERSTAKMHREKKEIIIVTTSRADMKRGHIKREQIENKK